MKAFVELSPAERVKAILATTEVPVDKPVALELSGIDLFGLSDKQRTKIEWAFSGSRLKGESPLYKMTAEQGQQTMRELDINVDMVYERIIDVLWPRLCNEIDVYTYRSGERKG
jgi:hypothetical protein